MGYVLAGIKLKEQFGETANLFKNKYPRQNEIIQKDTKIPLNDAKRVKEVTQFTNCA